MARQKSFRFEESKSMNNIMEFGKDAYLKMAGNWQPDFFRNANPLILELACGKGEYTYGLARQFPEKNFVGMDIKGSRIYVGAKACQKENIGNAAFLRGKIENLRSFFGWREVDEIWITFPDPRPRDRDEKRRLTFSRFLESYQHILKADGLVHLKTDNSGLMQYSIESVKAYGGTILIQTDDLYESPWRDQHFGIKTYFENKFTAIGHKIHYMRFQLPVLMEPLRPVPPIYLRGEALPSHAEIG